MFGRGHVVRTTDERENLPEPCASNQTDNTDIVSASLTETTPL